MCTSVWAYGSACRVWRSIFVICFLLVSFFSFLSSSHPIPFLQPAFQFSTISRSWWTLSFQSHLFPSKLPYVPGLPVPIGPPRWGNSLDLLLFRLSCFHKFVSAALVQIHSAFYTQQPISTTLPLVWVGIHSVSMSTEFVHRLFSV